MDILDDPLGRALREYRERADRGLSALRWLRSIRRAARRALYVLRRWFNGLRWGNR